MSDETAKLIDNEIRNLIDHAENHARKVLRKNMKHLHSLAKSLLEYETLSGDDVKQLIKKGKINNNQYEDGEIFLTTGTQTPSLHPLFSDSCVLVNKDINHRVLITKDNLGSFNLFSCYLKNESFCTYEINK